MTRPLTRRAAVVADHVTARRQGMLETAMTLQQEAGLPMPACKAASHSMHPAAMRMAGTIPTTPRSLVSVAVGREKEE